MIQEIEKSKVLKVFVYILIALISIYGVYALTRGLLSILALIDMEGLKTPYYLIVGSFNVLIMALALIYRFATKKRY